MYRLDGKQGGGSDPHSPCAAWTVLQQNSVENGERFIQALPCILNLKHHISYLFI